MWRFISKSFRNAVYLFKIQWQQGKIGVLFQLFFSLVNVLKSLVFIVFPKIIIDVCIHQSISLVMWFLFGFSLASFLLDAAIGIVSSLQSVYNLKFAHFFKRMIACKAMTMDYRDIESQECLDRLDKAIDSAYELSGSQLTDLFTYMLKLVSLIYIVSTLNFFLAMITCVVITLIYLINRKASKVNHAYEMRKTPYKRQQNYAENCVLNFNLAKDIRIYDGEDLFLGKYNSSFTSLVEIQKEKNRYNLLISLVKTALTALLNGGTYLYMIFKYSLGLVSISSFTMYLASVSEFYNAIDAVFFMLIDFHETNINLEEYENCLAMKETVIHSGKETINSVDRIEFKNVTFTYPGQTKPALQNVSFVVEKNEKVLLVGENGAGKTTIVKLLLRLYDVDDGEILINGINIKNLRYNAYVQTVAPVFQDVKLFAYSVEENIVLSKENCPERLYDSLEVIHINQRISKLPNGIKSYCTKEFDESGINFSGGEMQKLGIARALYQNGNLLIMDEPNSALDSLSEQELIHDIRQISKDKTCIFISHRLSMSNSCDKIIVLCNGQIAEMGTPIELRHSQGTFHRLFTMQASKYLE